MVLTHRQINEREKEIPKENQLQIEIYSAKSKLPEELRIKLF